LQQILQSLLQTMFSSAPRKMAGVNHNQMWLGRRSLYIDGKLASSLRLHIGSRNHPGVPSLEVFPHVLLPFLDAGRVVIDCTCLVADERLSRQYPALPYITLRPCLLAAEYFGGDDLLVAVRLKHQAFYRRAFNYRLLVSRNDIHN
jgi:hypothetical protein